MPPPIYSVPRPAYSPTIYPGYETAPSLAADTSMVELYYESIDDKHSHKKPLLLPLSPRNTANLPFSQDGSYSYDVLTKRKVGM